MKKPIILKKILRRCKKKDFIKISAVLTIFLCLFFIIIAIDKKATVSNATTSQVDNKLAIQFNEEPLTFSATVLPLTLNNSFSSNFALSTKFESETELSSEITSNLNSDDDINNLQQNEDYTLLEDNKEDEEETTICIDEQTTTAVINHDNEDVNQYINELINYYSSYDTRIELNFENIYLLGRLAIAESEGECFEGKVAVCEVVINRTISYNQTVSEIIFARNSNGSPQFSCIDDGRINLTPRNVDILAAVMAIIGEKPSNGSLFFDNPKKSPNSWASRNREKSIKIGDHQFYY